MNTALRVVDSVFDVLPRENQPTPLVRLRRCAPASDFALFAKLERMNPFGSVKGRAAWAMLRDLERRGAIDASRGIVEPTSGNTWISLAFMARDQLEVCKLYDPSLIDESLELDHTLAYPAALQLCRREGLPAGPSSGLVFLGASVVATRDRVGLGVMIFPDSVFKYTSLMLKHAPWLAGGVRSAAGGTHAEVSTPRGPRGNGMGARKPS